jgi:hypothetical protein
MEIPQKMRIRRTDKLILIFSLIIMAVIAACATPTLQPTMMVASTQIPNIPSKPEEIIDGRILPAWDLMANYNDPQVRSIAQFILTQHIKVSITTQYNRLDDTHAAVFDFLCENNNPPLYAGDAGVIKISEKLLNKADPVEVAGVLIHETVHAHQLIRGDPCECTLSKEYEADAIQINF